MNKYLQKHLVDFEGYGESSWTVADAVQGVQIFGSTGSGKTSGSGRHLAMTFLKNGFGGLVLTVKPDEKELWKCYCRHAGRYNDLVVIEPGRKHHFDFLAYESARGYTENILDVLKVVIQASAERSGQSRQDKFWQTALETLIANVIDLCRIAYGGVTVQRLYDIVNALPRKNEKDAGGDETDNRAFQAAGKQAVENVNRKIAVWEGEQTASDIAELHETSTYERKVCEHVPDARTLRLVEQYFMQFYAQLHDRTRSILDFSFIGFLSPLLRDPFYGLFCNGGTDAKPELSLDGKIILINLPVKLFHKAGRDCQIMYKYIWQRAMERRTDGENGLPVFLWADESQHFVHEHDAAFQATARSSFVSTVYLTQTLSNYYASMGGEMAQYRVRGLLGTLATKIFHANTDTVTNDFASALIGDTLYEQKTRSSEVGGQFSLSETVGTTFDKAVRMEAFPRLMTGGFQNAGVVEAYVHFQGRVLAKKQNCVLANFRQETNPEKRCP